LRFTCPTSRDLSIRICWRRWAEEFTHAFGGCTIVHGLDGRYLSQTESAIQDRLNLIYADTPYPLTKNFPTVEAYADKLNRSALAALDEEAILVVVSKVYHSELL